MSDQDPWASGRRWEQPAGDAPAGSQQAQASPPPPPPPQYQYPPQAPQYGYGPAAPQTDGMAIGALICALVSFVVAPVIAAIVALVLASQARRKIEASGGALTGEALNTAAVVIAWANIALCILGLIAMIFVWSSWMSEFNGAAAMLFPG